MKNPAEPPDKYVEALAGSDIQTNPPETLEAVERSGKRYTRQVDRMPAPSVLEEIDREVDMAKMEETLMAEGAEKFAKPMKMLLELIEEKRRQLVGSR